MSALADGSLPDDVRDRSLAHVAVCEHCRAALDVERLLVERLRSMPDCAPSAALLDRLLALGEPGGPLPPRPGRVAGSPRQPVLAVPGAPAGRPGAATRPTSSRPGGRRRASRRSIAVAAAGVLGAGVIAVTALGSTLPSSGPAVVPPVEQLVVDRGATGTRSPFTESVLVRVLTPVATSGPTAVPVQRRVTTGR